MSARRALLIGSALLAAAGALAQRTPDAPRLVGNSPPSVHITSPDPLAYASPGTVVTLAGEAHDPEDGDAACDELEHAYEEGERAHFVQDLSEWRTIVERRRAFLERHGFALVSTG